MPALEHVRQRARTLRRDVLALYLAARDSRVLWYAKAVAACVAVYALSPIDLIPEVIPILGYLDDLLIVPLGIWVAIRLIPPSLLEEHRHAAMARHQPRPISWVGAAIILSLWGLAGGAMVWWLTHEVSLCDDFARLTGLLATFSEAVFQPSLVYTDGGLCRRIGSLGS